MLPSESRRAAVLAHFGVDETALLGFGGEAAVYALDDARVVRIERHGIPGYLERRQVFYADLARHALPFETSEIFEIGTLGDTIYAVERRLTGTSLQDRYAGLTDRDRLGALRAYWDAARALGTVELVDPLYGEVLAPRVPIRRPRWTDYLLARLDAMLEQGYADLVDDVADVDRVLADLRRRIVALDDAPPMRLVHGDLGPANVLVDDNLTVTAVIDFGYATLAGDPRLDMAGALAFIELAPGYAPHHSAQLRTAIMADVDTATLDVLGTYRAYYGAYFSGCKADDPATYSWCVQVLREMAESA